MKRILVLMVCLLAVSTLSYGQQENSAAGFDFYGIRFGMSREEVKAVMKTDEKATEALNPGHGMMFLTFDYDHMDRLWEMRASYQRPVDQHPLLGLREALKEKFVRPVAARHRDVSVNFDEYSNAASITLIFTSLDRRQTMIDHFKEEALKSME